MKWWKGALGLERDGADLGRKQFAGDFGGLAPGRQDGDNFRRNLVTLAEYDDGNLGGRNAAIGLAATWACVRLISGTNASLPMGVFRTAADGTRSAARDHPLYALLHDSPNADQTAFDFWDFVNCSIELAGNAFAVKEFGTLGRIRALTLIRPDAVTVRRAGDGSLIYTWSDGGQRYEEPQDKVLHIRGPGGNPLGGLSTLGACRAAFGAAVSAERASTAILRNGVRPSGTLSMDSKLTQEQRAELESLLGEKFIGAMHAGRPMLLDGGLKWAQLTIDPVDAQLLESRKFSGEEICRVFGVPPAMAGYGDKASNWGTGKEVDVSGFQKFSLMPRQRRIEQALMKQLLTPRDRAYGIVIEINNEALLRADSAARAEFYKAALGDTQRPGWMVRNEVRRLENQAPIPGWDEPVELFRQAPAGAPPSVSEGA